MAEEVEMTPVTAAEPPKVNPLTAHKPLVRNPTATLKPGLRLPPKPGTPTATLKPGLKLPPKPGTPTATLKPGLKLPPKPVIRKPGATVTAAPLPKPVTSVAAPAAAAQPAPAVAKPVSVDAQGVGKLPTVEAKTIARDDAAPAVTPNPKPLEALKSVTQKLKGVTQEIPQQAILRKTGIIAEGAMTEAQKEAAKHKTARISLSDAMGVAPVKNENAPMKTIRIRRPSDIPGATKPLTPQPSPTASAAAPASVAPTSAASAPDGAGASSTITQRKTLKIARPSGAVRPAGKFGVKRPSQAATVTAPTLDAASAGETLATVADIADIPDMPMAPIPPVAADKGVSDGPAWLWTLSALVQAAACVAIGALAWFLFQNTQIAYF